MRKKFKKILDSIEYDFRYRIWKIKKWIRIHFDKDYVNLYNLCYKQGEFVVNCCTLLYEYVVTISKTTENSSYKIIIKEFICETEQEFEETKKKAKHICDLLNNL